MFKRTINQIKEFFCGYECPECPDTVISIDIELTDNDKQDINELISSMIEDKKSLQALGEPVYSLSRDDISLIVNAVKGVILHSVYQQIDEQIEEYN